MGTLKGKGRKSTVIGRYIGNCETLFWRMSVVQYRQINAGTLALLVACNGAKLEKTSLSTSGSKVPCL